MLRKVRPTTHRENGSASQPKVGLSDGRLALVHRYMVDAEEAEARARTAAETDEAHARTRALADAAARAAAEGQERREMKRPSPDPQRTQPRREGWVAARARREPEFVGGADQVARNVSRIPEVPKPEGQSAGLSPRGGEKARTLRAVAKEERRAAKHAAHLLASLEKREARERKALAKAAARRQPKGIF